MDGQKILIPLVIGKFLKPQCMKTCKQLSLVQDANQKAWIKADKRKKTDSGIFNFQTKTGKLQLLQTTVGLKSTFF